MADNISPKRTRSGKVFSSLREVDLIRNRNQYPSNSMTERSRVRSQSRVVFSSADFVNVTELTSTTVMNEHPVPSSSRVVGNEDNRDDEEEEEEVVGDISEPALQVLSITNDQIEVEEVRRGVSEEVQIIEENLEDHVRPLVHLDLVTPRPVRVRGLLRSSPVPRSLAKATPPLIDLTDSPQKVQTPNQTSIKCPVCLESISTICKKGYHFLSTMCGHIFCSQCLPKCLEQSKQCPSCRMKLSDNGYHQLFL